MTSWLQGPLGGLPRWAVILAALGVVIVLRRLSAGRRSAPGPDGGVTVPTQLAGYKTYRTVRGRAA